MNNQQIEEWIDANKQLAFVDENHAEHMIPIDRFRKMLKDNAIVPREGPTDKMVDALYPSSGRTTPGATYKAMIEASENSPELSQSESNRK